MSLRILVVDDHDLMRLGVRTLLGTRAGWEICAEARNGREAIAKSEQLRPDVIVMDISMPEMNGLEAARRIRKMFPATEVLVLSVHYSDQLIREIVSAGVRGFLVKGDSEQDLITAVEALSKHKPFFTPRATDVVLNQLRADGLREAPQELISHQLTPREREIIQLLAEGKSSKDVAESLAISVKTAETHRANIMRKLDLHNVSELVLYAVRNQIVEP